MPNATSYPMCDECDEPMHPHTTPDGREGFSCDKCGWSFDQEDEPCFQNWKPMTSHERLMQKLKDGDGLHVVDRKRLLSLLGKAQEEAVLRGRNLAILIRQYDDPIVQYLPDDSLGFRLWKELLQRASTVAPEYWKEDNDDHDA